MSMQPKCTSWRGHKFEGRYSTGAARKPTPDELFWVSVFDHVDAAKTRRQVTYERDVCVRCGLTIEKQPAPATGN